MIHLFTYDSSQTEFDFTAIHNTITKSTPLLLDWWHYLPNVYLVETNSPSRIKSLTQEILNTYKGLRFFVVKVDLTDHNGVLNKDAWTWISKKINTEPRLKIVKPVIASAAQRYLKIKAAPTNTNYSQEAIKRALDELLGRT